MKQATLFVLSAILFFSCKKDSNEGCVTNTASISGSYKVTAVTYKPSTTAAEIDYYTTIYSEACERDDIITLNANGTYQFVDAGVACTPPDDYTGTWSSAGNTIELDGDISTIQSFDCKNLIVVTPDNLVAGDQTKLTLTKQ